jgi:hypothetical protein
MIYGLSKDQMRRVGDVVRHVENSPLGAIGKGPNAPSPLRVRPATTTSTVSARTGSTPGSGTARWLTYDPETNELGEGDEFDIKNYLTSTWSDNTDSLLLWWAGCWWIIGAAC